MASAGTSIITHQNHRQVRYVQWDWTSHASTGDVSGGAGLTPFAISGEVVRITSDPGTPAPTDNYDAVINDDNGVDVAGGLLANRDTANTESVVPLADVIGSKFIVDGKLELVVTNAGNSKAGMTRLYYR